MTNSNKRFEIVDGPTVNGFKRAFCDAFGENDCSTRFTVYTGWSVGIDVESGRQGALLDREEISVKLNSISYEDGSGNNFSFQGYITNTEHLSHLDISKGQNVEGFYNARKKEGWIGTL